MRRTIRKTFAVIFWGSVSVAASLSIVDHIVNVGIFSADVDEDSPYWNCATMGNHECGPGIEPATVPVGWTHVTLPNGNTLWIKGR